MVFGLRSRALHICSKLDTAGSGGCSTLDTAGAGSIFEQVVDVLGPRNLHDRRTRP
jgi:hypothetical protein